MSSSKRGEARWLRQPALGRLTGDLYLDGSALHPQVPALRRAGWSITQLDAAGLVVGQICGAVDSSYCPGQTARDGEDWAVFMLSDFALAPCKLNLPACWFATRMLKPGAVQGGLPAAPAAPGLARRVRRQLLWASAEGTFCCFWFTPDAICRYRGEDSLCPCRDSCWNYAINNRWTGFHVSSDET